ncbi:hypothetical protein GIB67_034768 [Kingdonia uniflora]|uniref:Phosphofructokinase domain-containing protein n=1 Tax=Kingdonia uniflora TaxID=39325 RepID=A0A7J7MDS3_9MAGN|nr:hypothetical protein GIB67_034768 [Kingdonia uniflora]
MDSAIAIREIWVLEIRAACGKVIDKSFGFDTAVEEAQRTINTTHVEAESVENGVGVVKLMGRYSGFIAMYATLASRDVDCCLISESPFFLEGSGVLFEFIQKRLKEIGHMVIVIAEGAGQELLSESQNAQEASGNKVLKDVGLWLSQKIKVCDWTRTMEFLGTEYGTSSNLTFIFILLDPTCMIRAVPSNASDNVYCTLLAHSVLHGAMAGYAGFTVGPVNGRHAYIPFYLSIIVGDEIVIDGRMVSFEVIEKVGNDLHCKCTDSGLLLPRAKLSFWRNGELANNDFYLPTLSTKWYQICTVKRIKLEVHKPEVRCCNKNSYHFQVRHSYCDASLVMFLILKVHVWVNKFGELELGFM